MKKLFTLLTMLIVAITSSWADDVEITQVFSSNNKPQNTIHCVKDNVEYGTVSCDKASSNRAIVGKKSDGSVSYNMRFTAATGYALKSIVLTWRTGSNYAPTLEKLSATNAEITNVTTITCNENATEVVLSHDVNNENSQVTQVVITYTTSGGSSKTATTTTITSASKASLDLAINHGTAAGTLTATVVDAESAAVEGATVSWESSDESVATINASTGAVTLKATGTTTLKATYAGNDDYAESEDSYEITVTDTRTASDLSVASEASVKIGKTETVAYTTSSTGAVSVESSNNSVATAVVDQVNKNITISGVAAGVATITVSQLADDDYAAGSKEISVTVIDPIAGTVIYNWNTVGTTTIVSTATTANVSIKGTSTSAISFPNGLTKPAYAKIEVEGGFKKGDIITWTGCINNKDASKDGAIMIANGYDINAEGYKAYLAVSDKFNNVNDGSTDASPGSFVLTEDADELYIGRAISGLSSATNTYLTQLTVTRPSTETVTIGKGGFSTFAGEYNYTVSGAKALAAQNKNTSVGFTEIPSETIIPANTGVVLQGAEGDEVTITYTNAAAGSVATDMVGVTEANPFVASSNVYVIATKTAGTKFYKYTGSTFPVGKAYLNAAVNAGDALDIVFDGATAIEAIAEANANSVAPVKVIKNGKLYIGNYNVAGQQVK